MIELFTDLSEFEKNMIELAVNLAMLNDDLFKITKALNDYRTLCNERQQEYMDFYFNLQLEELKRENIDN